MDNFGPCHWITEAHVSFLGFLGVVMHLILFKILRIGNCRGEVGDGSDPAADAAAEAAAAAAKGDWTTGLEPSHQEVVKMKGWKAPNDVIKSYTELDKLMGLEKIPAPRKDKTGNFEKGELERVMGALGMPKDPKEYKTSDKFKLPEGVVIDQKFMSDFQTKAHAMGLLPHQYAFVMDELATVLNQGTEAQRIAGEKAFNESAVNLKNKWGLAYDDKMKLANNVLRNFVGDAKTGKEIAAKYGNDPLIIELLANVGDNLSEEALTRTNMSGSLLTPEAAKLEINKIKADPNHPYMKANHPDHQFWVDKMAELYKMSEA